MNKVVEYKSYWQGVWEQLKKHRLGRVALYVFFLFVFVGIYAPFFASSKPLAIKYDGVWYFPLFRYLFYPGFFTKRLDLFFNILMFTAPFFLLAFKILKSGMTRKLVMVFLLIIQFGVFIYVAFSTPQNPEADRKLIEARLTSKKAHQESHSWEFELTYMTPYARLNLVLREYLRKKQNQALEPYRETFEKAYHQSMPTLWNMEQANEAQELEIQRKVLESNEPTSLAYKIAQQRIESIQARRHWLDEQIKKIDWIVMPIASDFHWEDDAGGSQAMNQVVPWWQLTRINRKSLLAALIFGIRISLSVGLIAVGIALAIGIPVGAFAGFYGGTFDILTSRLLEIWESMPTFFMLLIVVAMLQSKSIFVVITVIGLFSWTTFARYIRGEFFKQRNLPYVEACHAQGFNSLYVIFSHILPNAIPPVLTLLPFSIMAAITSEAGLSFLGLGEEGSCSWGVLMDEGRTAFPAESYLLWPPAILLTILLVAIALVGDALRDSIDPKLRRI